MPRSVVLLRAVNLGPRNRIAMGDFRSLLEGLGCTDVQTYVQSGNAVVSSRRGPASLEAAVAKALRDELDLPVDVLVRTADELDAVVAENPFAGEDLPPTSVHVAFLSASVTDVPDTSPDRVVAGDRALYIAYADGLQGSAAAKALGSKRFSSVVATARNWRTVLALQELARP